MTAKAYRFSKLNKNDLPVLLDMAKDIILNIYADFLGEDIVTGYINSKQCDREIIENAENCIVMKLKNRCIGFSITLENKIHLMMIDRNCHRKKHGTYLLKHVENKLSEKYDAIELLSFADNTAANRFYEKNGWEKVETANADGISMNKYNKRIKRWKQLT